MRKKILGYVIFHIGLVIAMVGCVFLGYFEDIFEFMILARTPVISIMG